MTLSSLSLKAFFVSSLMVALAAGCGDSPEIVTPPIGGGGGEGGETSGDAGAPGTGGGIKLPGAGGDGGETGANPCDVEDPPEECFNTVPSGPACGDGEINQDNEECDDGNSLPGDGCSGRCEEEPYFVCGEPGEACVSTIACGDGLLDPGEFCDDGNTVTDDGCSDDCLFQDPAYVCPVEGLACRLLYECGDGRVSINAGEKCDDGNLENGDGCSAACEIEDGFLCGRPGNPCVTNEYCGDGVIQNTEECDDGDLVRDDTEIWGDGCSGICTLDPYFECPEPGVDCLPTISCGNGEREPGEACDDGNDEDGDGCTACVQDASYICPTPGQKCARLYQCGDGRINGSDECDDGDTVGGDGCSANCTVEPGWLCRQPGNACVRNEFCGDGLIQATRGETCDDGNIERGDGCSSCTVDPYYTCPAAGQSCVSTIECGDGRRDPGEACDDGNTDNGDGCNATCEEKHPDFFCPPNGGDCIRLVECGDRRVNGSETCDDGNTNSGDGCSASCLLETGYRCPVPGEACTGITSCGDGTRNLGEACDDGNTTSGDGCNVTCRIETDWSCTAANPSVCTYTVVCGDGLINGTEVCDDGNVDGGDGCSANCTTQETGFECTREGYPCRPVCGDGLTRGDEQCDDGNTAAGDGCNARCRLEENTVCTGGPDVASECQDAVCGQNGKEGTEPCDDGNDAWGDGCTPDCKLEPSCAPGEPCSSACGDGIKFPNESCDDGNDTDGDGCSATCEVEDGYVCSEGGAAPDQLRLTMIVRDFMAGAPNTPSTNDSGISIGHTDFEFGGAWNNNDGLYRDSDTNNADNWTNAPTLPGSGDAFGGGRGGNIRGRSQAMNGLVYGYVDSTIGANKKPVFAFNGSATSPSNMGNCPLSFGSLIRNSQGFCARLVQNATSFNRWFVDDDAYNNTYRRTLILRRSGNTYSYDSETHRADGTAYPSSGPKGFWPLDDPAAQAVTGVTRYRQCGSGPFRNFHFTSEVHHWFQFDASAPPVLSFSGDDDVFVFIGGRLALDLGGIHRREEAIVTLNAAGDAVFTRPGGSTVNMPLGLEDGGIYEFVVFQAERNTCESNYWLTLQNFNLRRSVCEPVCGDGIVTPDEQCDDGDESTDPPNNTPTPVYNACTEISCTLGPYCGDGIRQAEFGEECDNGSNLNTWGATGANACAAGCRLPPRCGDGDVDSGFEECDLGSGNTASGYDGCTTSCVRGPYCGDGTRNGTEFCDDGVNNGAYGTCGVNCTPPPRCGDGQVQADWGEECDGGAACGSDCRLKCGNGSVEAPEQCDDGVNAGGYDRCAPGCVRGPYCGDGTVDPQEECDNTTAQNTGIYAGCTANCTRGPYCGDGILNGSETCDDGVNDGFYGSCEANCTPAERCGDGVVQEEWGEQCDGGPNCSDTCQPIGICGDRIKQPPEECDEGVNLGGYGRCGPECRLGPYCGDGVVQPAHEQCDEGPQGNLGGYAKCGPLCRFGPYCGDGIVQEPQETCDDGVNDSFYGSCTPECDGGPRCGDGIVQEEWGEDCDDDQDPNCVNCRLGALCGDSVVQAGEQCDDGVNDGGYGECGPRCQYGPRCGDGVKNGDEQCDDGEGKNTGGYGKCAPGCVYGPYCGDGKLQSAFEDCDDGNNRDGDACSSACRRGVPR